jgi:hypothetical protein
MQRFWEDVSAYMIIANAMEMIIGVWDANQ